VRVPVTVVRLMTSLVQRSRALLVVLDEERSNTPSFCRQVFEVVLLRITDLGNLGENVFAVNALIPKVLKA
jgi:hypothetical protein